MTSRRLVTLVSGSEGIMWHFSIDQGGTFTDVVARTPGSTVLARKVLSHNPRLYRHPAAFAIRDIIGLAPNAPLPRDLPVAIRMGTTVATNMLLERSGERTLLLITHGFRDLLKIGYQNRPDLFTLDIAKPIPLYEQVEEVWERVDVDGRVVIPLDAKTLERVLKEAYCKGFRSVAIAFMHSCAFPKHELQAGELARDVGFSYVALSCHSSSRTNFIPRCHTAVVDAYLTPALKASIKAFCDDLGLSLPDIPKALAMLNGHTLPRIREGQTVPVHHIPLLFMQSNGGLASPKHFLGQHAVFSGPAGGVIATAELSASIGGKRLIGIDMGGTSTDVCVFDGELPRSYEKEISGALLQVPMLDIQTVAAGGSSILHFSQNRFQVGPKSAGADPGPACYRKEGPLTITDVNLFLGRLQPQHFPYVFGKNATETLDASLLDKKFLALANEIFKRSGCRLSAPMVGEGYLEVACENIANAVNKISLRRGLDTRAYGLHAFGSAIGQIVCRVADKLGIDEIFLHILSGMQSAYGIGLAQYRIIQERACNFVLEEASYPNVVAIIEEVTAKANVSMTNQGLRPDVVSSEKRAHIRYAGSNQALVLPFGTIASMKADFLRIHRERYGFVFDNRALLISILSAECIGQVLQNNKFSNFTPRQSAPVSEKVPLFLQEKWHEVPLFQWHSIGVKQRITGPAMVVSRSATVVIEHGWQASMNDIGCLVLKRMSTTNDKEISRQKMGLKNVMLEIFNNRFMFIAEQMGIILQQTAHSINIKERMDFSCALFDGDGNLTANAPHIPVHLGSMEDSVKMIMRRFGGDCQEGDAYMMNSPFCGGTHLPDITVVMPAFEEDTEKPEFFVATRAHHTDIGGKTPGSMPADSCCIGEEGVMIEGVRILHRGKFMTETVQDILSAGRWPARNVVQNLEDLEAQVGSCIEGIRQVRETMRSFGKERVLRYMRLVQDNAEQSVRELLRRLDSGTFTNHLDTGDCIQVAISIDMGASKATLDFHGTSSQSAGNHNAPLSVCKACVLYVLRTLLGEDIPLNSGCLKPITLLIPQRTIINPEYPAAVVAGNTEISQAIVDTLLAAFRASAGSQGTMNNIAWGDDDKQNYETLCGGSGAGPSFHGADAVHCHMTNTKMTDPEVLEREFPVRVETIAIRNGSGGGGRFHGGCGMVRSLRFLKKMQVSLVTSRRTTAPFGLLGGENGKCGRNRVQRGDGSEEVLQASAELTMGAGDLLIIETPGGGGYGQPLGVRATPVQGKNPSVT